MMSSIGGAPRLDAQKMDRDLRDFLLAVVFFLLTHERHKDALILMEATHLLFHDDIKTNEMLAYTQITCGEGKASLRTFEVLKKKLQMEKWQPMVKALYGTALMQSGRTIEAGAVFTSFAALRLAEDDTP